MRDWLRLIRWKNLAIVFFTQFSIWFCLVEPQGVLPSWGDSLRFFMLALSTGFIAAGGYIINDYFDIQIDVINRPEKVVLEHKINLRQAILAHLLLSTVGLLVAFFVSGALWLVIIQLLCVVLLWFYSTHFKRLPVIGNFVISILTTLTIIVIYLNYIPGLSVTDVFSFKWAANASGTTVYVLIYAFYSFFLTWIREIVKDMEDIAGDSEMGCKTLPIVAGLNGAIIFIVVLEVVMLVAGIIAILNVQTIQSKVGIFLFLVAPMFVWTWFLLRKSETAHYGLASKYIKFYMVAGLFTLYLFRFYF